MSNMLQQKGYFWENGVTRRNITQIDVTARTSLLSFISFVHSVIMLFLILSIATVSQRVDEHAQSNTRNTLIVHAFSTSNTIRQKWAEPISLSFFPKARQVIIKRKTTTLYYSDPEKDVNLNPKTMHNIPTKPLQPPFPDGLNKGRIVTLPQSDHFLRDRKLSGKKHILPPRDILVWLPPDYDLHPDMNFPVLYCHDGQNAIQDSFSWTGSSWRLAGALSRMSERGLLTRTTKKGSPPILVLIPSASDQLLFVPRRHLEYGDSSQIFAQTHADFVALTLKPLIDKKFRTVSGKEGTAVMGTSLGGQASLYLCLRHPNLFGAAVCMSPCFQAGILASVATLDKSVFDGKMIYLDNGGDHDEVKVPLIDVWDHVTMDHWWNPGYWWLDSQLQPTIDAMKFALDARRIKYEYNKIAGGRHNERGWASRIHLPLLFLYGNRAEDENYIP